METVKDRPLHPSISIFSGILLALFVFSLTLMQVILLFGEGCMGFQKKKRRKMI